MDGASREVAVDKRRIAMMTHISASFETIIIVTLVLTVLVVGARIAKGNDAIPATNAACRIVVDYPPNPGPAQNPRPARLYFVDARTGIDVHGVVLSWPAAESVAPRRFSEISGSYTGSRGTREKGGRFYATFYHNGPRGASLEDCFELRLCGGEYDGYYYAGPLDDSGAFPTD
jgi:hypothetical protein